MTVVLPMEFENMDHKFRGMGFQKLAPPSEVYKQSWKHDQLFQQVDGKKYRRIFFNVQFDHEEIVHIAQIRKLLVQENMNDLFTDGIILKNYIAAKFSYKKTVERLKNVHQFHTSQELTKFNQSTRIGLQRGFIYTYGYDKQFCPVVYTRPDLIDFKDQNFLNPIYCIMYIVQRYRMIPYHAEKYLLIIDLNNMNVSDIPYMKLYKIMHNISCLYTGFAKKTFILNSSGVGTMWTIMKRFIPDRAKKNIVFVQNYNQLDQYISPQQREAKYQGSLPNLISYWPPISSTPQTPMMMQKRITNKSIIHTSVNQSFSNHSYYSIQNNEQYFYNLAEIHKQLPSKKCNCKCSLI